MLQKKTNGNNNLTFELLLLYKRNKKNTQLYIYFIFHSRPEKEIYYI